MSEATAYYIGDILMNEPLTDPIRTAIIGLGRIGYGHHAKTILKHNGFTLCAVCDREPSRVEELVGQAHCNGYTSYEEMLKQEDIELVVVASQSHDHVQHTELALRAGKHVLCEKPACQQAAQFEKLIQLAEQHKLFLTVHHNQRLSPQMLILSRIIDDGLLGKIFRIRRAECHFKRRNDWQVLRKYNGGLLANWGVHIVDQTLCLAGAPPKSVWSRMRREFNPGDCEDDIRVMVECTNNVVLDLEISYVNAAAGPDWTVLGNRGSAWIENDHCTIQYIDGEIPPLEAVDAHLAPAQSYEAAQDSLHWERRILPLNAFGRHEGFYDNLYRVLRQGATPTVSAQSALTTYQTLDMIREQAWGSTEALSLR